MRMNRLLALVVTAVLLAGCGKAGQESVAPGVRPAVVKGVKLEQARIGEYPETLEAVGTIKAVTQSIVSARITGTVVMIAVKEGDRVKKGQMLGTIEADEALAGAAAAQAGVEEAARGVEEARSRKKLADATFTRYQRLFAEQAVTRQEFENRQAEQEIASQGVARAEARLLQARESARAAVARSDHTRIVSPIHGVVTAKTADQGSTVFPGTPILTIEEQSAYLLEVQAPESLKGRVSVGQSLAVAMEGERALTGQVSEVVPVVDAASRTFTVKISVASKGLRSGSYGRAYFPVGKTQGMLVPKAAILERGALTSVWVVDAHNIARMRLVKTGKTLGNDMEILSGLASGEHFAAAGIEQITDGVKVE